MTKKDADVLLTALLDSIMEAVAAALGKEGFEAVDCERLQEWVGWMYWLNP